MRMHRREHRQTSHGCVQRPAITRRVRHALGQFSRVNRAVQRLLCGVAAALSLAMIACGAKPSMREPLGQRELANLEAFARLYGVVRYFHPTEGVRTADWQAMAVRGAQLAEHCPSADSLARVLQHIFAPVAPTVRVFSAREAPSRPSALPARAPSIRYWRHRGLDTEGTNPAYASEIVTIRAAALPTSAPDPRAPLRLSLGGGVSAVVPMALYIDSGPSAEPRSYAPAQVPMARVDERSIQIGAAVAAWATLSQFYPYSEETRIDWRVALPRLLQGAAGGDSASFLRALRRFAASLDDGHAYAYRLSRGGSPSGAPALRAPGVILDWIEEQVVVTGMDSDADVAGLRVGDALTRVDGRPMDVALAAAESLESGATVRYRRRRAVRYLLIGPPGTSVTVTVRSPAGELRTVRLGRSTRPPRPAGGPSQQGAAVRDVGRGIVYVDLARLTDSTFRATLLRVVESRGVIFDLRGYPPFDVSPVISRLTDSVLRTPRFEVQIRTRPDDPHPPVEDRSGRFLPAAPRLRGRVAFLIGTGSISAVETILGTAEAYRLGELVGDSTAGTNGNVNTLLLPGGYGMQFTGMRVRKPDGSRHHGVGIGPTISAPVTVAGLARDEDEALARAVEVLDAAAPVDARGP